VYGSSPIITVTASEFQPSGIPRSKAVRNVSQREKQQLPSDHSALTVVKDGRNVFARKLVGRVRDQQTGPDGKERKSMKTGRRKQQKTVTTG
jgi:hypothetical protein